MLFTREFKAGIRAGRVTRTYRRWKKPQARVGGRYNLAPDGVIEVTSMKLVHPARIRTADAVRAGFPDRSALLAVLGGAEPVYQIDFRFLGAGLVRQPAQGRLDDPAVDALAGRLARMDDRAETPWTARALRAIGDHPGRRAADLAPSFGWDTPTFKRQIRKLKGLGLTRSLEVGYELSPLGRQILEHRGV